MEIKGKSLREVAEGAMNASIKKFKNNRLKF